MKTLINLIGAQTAPNFIACREYNTGKDYYGRVTGPGDIHYNKNILQNGYAFSLKFKE